MLHCVLCRVLCCKGDSNAQKPKKTIILYVVCVGMSVM